MLNLPMYTVVIVAAWSFAGPLCYAENEKPAAPKLNRFDQMDPEIRKAAEIDFSEIKMADEPLRTRTIAGIALGDLLKLARKKAEIRLELAQQYLTEQDLLEDFTKKGLKDRDLKPMTFEQGQKLAVAYVKSPTGARDFAGRLIEDDPEMMKRVALAYDRINEKSWGETQKLRQSVDVIARYLDEQGKFDEFMVWAKVEAEKQNKANKEEMIKRQVEYAKRLEVEQAARVKVANENAQRRHEERMKRLELAYEYKTEKLKAQRDVSVAYQKRYETYNGWGNDHGHYYRNHRNRYNRPGRRR